MTSQLQVVEETRVPGENHRLTPSHWQLSHMPRPGFEPRQWWEIACSQWQTALLHVVRTGDMAHIAGKCNSILANQSCICYATSCAARAAERLRTFPLTNHCHRVSKHQCLLWAYHDYRYSTYNLAAQRIHHNLSTPLDGLLISIVCYDGDFYWPGNMDTKWFIDRVTGIGLKQPIICFPFRK